MNTKTTLLLAALLMSGTALAGGGLDSFMNDLNAQARIDMDGFSASVSTQFGIPQVRVRAVIGSVGAPADAFLVFQLGQWTGLPPDRVVEVYQSNKGKGWGVIAKELGIKPGSAEFHRLKSGDLHFKGQGGGSSGKHGKSKGKGKHSS